MHLSSSVHWDCVSLLQEGLFVDSGHAKVYLSRLLWVLVTVCYAHFCLYLDEPSQTW